MNGNCAKDFLKPAFQYVKECNSDIIANGCWITNKNIRGSDSTSWLAGSDAGLVLKNGMLLMIRWHSNDCSFINADSSNFKCGWVAVDVNGFKPPNRFGKDTFGFTIQDAIVKPFGADGDSIYSFGSCSTSDDGFYSGFGCSAKYLSQ